MEEKKKTAREIIEGYQGPPVRIMEVCGTHTHEIFRLGIAATNTWTQQTMGKAFVDLSPEDQDKALTAIQKGIEGFEQVPSATFFSTLWGTTKEGFFSDPIHGGNKDMVGWKLIGFPGARADFMDWIERDEKYPLPPVSIKGLRG